MGFAKYYEDNVSICIERMAVQESVPLSVPFIGNKRVVDNRREIQLRPVVEQKADKVRQPMKNGRRGIELYFVSAPEVRICRKLQLNGWWWSEANQCWCNINNNENHKYAEDIARRYQVQFTVVAA